MTHPTLVRLLHVDAAVMQQWEELLQESQDANSTSPSITTLEIYPGQQPLPLQEPDTSSSSSSDNGSSSSSSSSSNATTSFNRSRSIKRTDWPPPDDLFALLESPLTRDLNKLVLTGCSRLTSLPSSITHLQQLRTLEICSCSSLQELSAGMGNLSKLQKLTVRACQELKKLPADLCCADQTELAEVRIESCTYLTGVPACLGGVSSLKVLSLHDNTRLNHVPQELLKCQQLEQFDIWGCTPLTDLMAVQPLRLSTLPAPECLALVVEASNR
jgi:hypothetical protein